MARWESARARVDSLWREAEAQRTRWQQHTPGVADYDALVFGQPVECVYVDYIGLVRSKKSRSRTEQTADVAESLKSMAVELGVVLFVTTQVHRRSDSDDAVVPSLHSAKDSSSVEASAQLLIGVWRPDETPETVFAKVLKYTNGRAGRVVECVFDGERGTITQKSRAPLSGAELEE